MEKRELIEQTELFVLDMDGTFYLGDRLIEGALDFLSQVERTGKQFLFFTNNSSAAAEDYIAKLSRLGCTIDRDQLMTSGDVTAAYLNTHYAGQSVFLLGTPELRESFTAAGIPLTDGDAQIVVVGFDKTLTYARLSHACTLVRRGALFLATHPDINCPVEDGFIIDCGAFCAAMELSTGKRVRYLGKPYPETVEMILQRTGAKREAVTFVGDRLYTDIKTGVKNGAHGALVLSGETRREDIDMSDVKPDAVFESLGEMAHIMRTM